jgi:diguanylate cyclase (GGDEF)-like protein
MLSLMAAFSLRTQIAAVFTALLIGTAALLSFLWGERIRQSIESHISFSMVVMTDNLARLVARDLYQFNSDLVVLANSPTLLVEGWSSTRTRNALERLRASRSEFSWVGVIDAEGRVRNASDQLNVGTNVKDEPWFRAGLKGQHVGQPHTEPEFARGIITTIQARPPRYLDIATPIRDRKGNQSALGVLGVLVSWDWIRQVVETLRPPMAGPLELTICIFDREGQLIYAPDPLLETLENTGQRLPFTPRLIDENYESQPHRLPSRVVTWADGRSYLTTVIRLEGRSTAGDVGWYVVNRMPAETAFAEATMAAQQALILGLAIAVMGGIIAWVAAGRISADLRSITAAVQNVQPRQNDNSIPVYRSSKEVQVLSWSLHEMLDRLLRVRENMEAIIRQRTSELEAANYALAQQARTDTLTGLLNRRGFDDQSRQILASTWRNHQPLSLVMFDVDHFKRINDTLGHEVGDLVLKQLAETLRQRLRASDVLARMGGEEFMALLPDTNLEGARNIAESLVRAIAEQVDPIYGRYTISAGVASALAEQPDMAELMRRADAALYDAKGRGRNRVCLDPASGPVSPA